MNAAFLPTGGNFASEQQMPKDQDLCEGFVADCRIRLATDLLRHKWDPVVLSGLRLGGRRRAELLAAIGDASDKALTESLRRLTTSGLVATAPDATPRHVTYALTPLGATLVDGPMLALGRWAIEHGDGVAAAQAEGLPG